MEIILVLILLSRIKYLIFSESIENQEAITKLISWKGENYALNCGHQSEDSEMLEPC